MSEERKRKHFISDARKAQMSALKTKAAEDLAKYSAEAVTAAKKMTHIGTRKINDRIESYIKLKEKKLGEIETAYKKINEENQLIGAPKIIQVEKIDGDKAEFKILQPEDDAVKAAVEANPDKKEEDINNYNEYYDKDMAKIKELKDGLKTDGRLKIPKIPSFVASMRDELDAKKAALEGLAAADKEKDASLKKVQDENEERLRAEKAAATDAWIKVKEYLIKNLTIDSKTKTLLNEVQSNEKLVIFEKLRLPDEKQTKYNILPTWMEKSTTAGIYQPGPTASVVFKCEKNGYWGFVNGWNASNIQYYKNKRVGNNNNINDTLQISVNGTDLPIFIFELADNQDKSQCEEPEPVSKEGGKKKRKTNKKRKTSRRKRRSKKHL